MRTVLILSIALLIVSACSKIGFQSSPTETDVLLGEYSLHTTTKADGTLDDLTILMPNVRIADGPTTFTVGTKGDFTFLLADFP